MLEFCFRFQHPLKMWMGACNLPNSERRCLGWLDAHKCSCLIALLFFQKSSRTSTLMRFSIWPPEGPCKVWEAVSFPACNDIFFIQTSWLVLPPGHSISHLSSPFDGLIGHIKYLFPVPSAAVPFLVRLMVMLSSTNACWNREIGLYLGGDCCCSQRWMVQDTTRTGK